MRRWSGDDVQTYLWSIEGTVSRIQLPRIVEFNQRLLKLLEQKDKHNISLLVI